MGKRYALKVSPSGRFLMVCRIQNWDTSAGHIATAPTLELPALCLDEALTTNNDSNPDLGVTR